MPSALVCVAKAEADSYSEVVPANQLLLHDDLPSLISIRNWLNATIQEDCLVQIDDDLRCVRGLVGKARKITDPDSIRELIENSARVSADLDIGVFCWSRTQNVIISDPIFQPIRFVQPVSCAFGMRGSARNREFDPELPGRADFNFTMQTLLKDRILYADVRFYFDHGSIQSGLGGNVGVLTAEAYATSSEKLQKRWGKYVSFKPPSYRKKGTAQNMQSMSVRVRRQNPLVRLSRN